MADILSKITKFLIPEEEVEMEVKTEQEKTKTATSATTVTNTVRLQKAVGGEEYSRVASAPFTPVQEDSRPKLKVYKQPNMNILVFEPTNFNDTRIAADSLKNSKTVLMNYEKIEYSEQVRICDFMNGACYVLDGSVKRISANMVLYVPAGVSIEEIMANHK